MGLFLCMVQRVTIVLRILKKVNGTSLSGLHPVFHSIRSPWLYADRVGVGSLGRTFRRRRNSAGAFAPAGVPSGTQCAPSLVCRISPTATGSFTVNKKRKNYLRLQKRPLSGPFALLTLSPAPRSPSRALRACLLCFLPVCPGSSLPPSCSGHTAYYPETSMPAWTSPHKTSC